MTEHLRMGQPLPDCDGKRLFCALKAIASVPSGMSLLLQIIEALAKPLEEEVAGIDSGMKLEQENRAHCTSDEAHAFNRCAWLCQ